VTLDSSRLIDALGHNPFDAWPYDEIFVPTHAGWHHERDGAWHGSPELLVEMLYRNPRRRKHVA
jgi:dTDP-4-dehydrorhamnose reductase